MKSAMRAASQLEGGPLMWMLPLYLYLHVNQKSDYDIYDESRHNFVTESKGNN